MPLKFEVASLDEVDEPLRSLYSESNGKLEVADGLYEVDVPVASLPVGSGVADTRGEVATVIGRESVRLSDTTPR
jgi:hypothetical protein